MDTIYLRDLHIETVIGIYEWERRIHQTLRLDLEITVDLKPAGKTDNLADTIDYHAIAKRLMTFVSESQFHLLEALADQAARLVITEFGAERIKLAINKAGAIRGATSVGVIIERTRADYA